MLTLAEEYPGDVGILISLLLNRVTLERGEVVYLPAGNIHSYLHGLGIEVLASSDNVLRGGLTPKHVDVPELLAILDFRPLPVPFLAPDEPSPGVRVFRPDVPDFELAVLQLGSGLAESVSFSVVGDFLALCTDGRLSIRGAEGERSIAKGEAVYGTSAESPLVVTGSGELFIAAANSAFARK